MQCFRPVLFGSSGKFENLERKKYHRNSRVKYFDSETKNKENLITVGGRS